MVPEHRASPHTDITNFRGEPIIIADLVINSLRGRGVRGVGERGREDQAGVILCLPVDSPKNEAVRV